MPIEGGEGLRAGKIRKIDFLSDFGPIQQQKEASLRRNEPCFALPSYEIKRRERARPKTSKMHTTEHVKIFKKCDFLPPLCFEAKFDN
ncbi:MAG TPA: hypothetical protein VEA37_09340 [Flavobacterium sp.]|nr:hypothetical protein [Flavobacterium sp.]